MVELIKDALTPDEINGLRDFYERLDIRQKFVPGADKKIYEEEPGLDSPLDRLLRPILTRIVDYDYVYAPTALFMESGDYTSRLHSDNHPDVGKWGHIILIPLKIYDPRASTVFFDNHLMEATDLTMFDRGHPTYASPIANVDGDPVWFDDLRIFLPLIDKQDEILEVDGHKFYNNNRLKFRIKSKTFQGGYYRGDPNTYLRLTNLDFSQTIDDRVYNRYLAHIPRKDLEGLVLSHTIDWHIGDVIKFERSVVHCGGCYDRGKIGLTVFLNRK